MWDRVRVGFVCVWLIAAGAAAAQEPPAKTKPADPPAKAGEKKPADAPAKAKSVLTFKLPHEMAELFIEGQPTKLTGVTREFDTPELDAGMPYKYDFKITFAPNNYTTITRIKSIQFKAGDAVTVDMTPAAADDKAVIRFVPTPDDIVTEMVKIAKVGKDDVVYDLGCGDGRIVVAAVKEGKAKKGVGIDLDPERVKESRAAAKGAKVEIRQGDILDIKDLSDATVVMLYMGDELGVLLKPVLLKTLKVGTRVVSHRFTLGDWKPDKTVVVTGEDGEEYTLHSWVVTDAVKKK